VFARIALFVGWVSALAFFFSSIILYYYLGGTVLIPCSTSKQGVGLELVFILTLIITGYDRLVGHCSGRKIYGWAKG